MENDRPYGGWLYVGAICYVRSGEELDFYELDVGVIGPASLSEPTQITIHEWIGSQEPMGWHHQLSNEVGANFIYQRKNRFRHSSGHFDAVTHYGGCAGTVFTYVNTGAMIRFGYNLPDDFGFLHMEPTARKLKTFGVYGLAAVDGRAVARNAFLDGNLFEDSHSVDKEWLVGDLSVGVGTTYKNFELIYAHTFRSKEFKKQEHSNMFGTLNIVYHF